MAIPPSQPMATGSSNQRNNTVRRLFWAWVVILFILHQDFWLWDDKWLVMGFLPVGLFYHAMFSIVASVTWVIANKFAWPVEIEEWADGGDDPDGGSQ